MVSDWNDIISATTRPIATINISIQRSFNCASNREKPGGKALQTSEIHCKTWRKASCRLSKTKRDRSRSVEQLRSSVFLESKGLFFLVTLYTQDHRVQSDPGYHNNRKWLLFARRRAAAADRPEKGALFLELVNFERTLQLELTANFHK